MKKIFVYTVTLFLIASFFLSCAQTKINETPKNLQGVWILKANRTSDKLELGFLPVMSNLIKMITPDGKFSNIAAGGTNAFIVTDGLFKVESATVFTESIKRSIYSNLIGMNNSLQFRIENENKLYLKWFAPKNVINNNTDIWVEELWEKVEIPRSN